MATLVLIATSPFVGAAPDPVIWRDLDVRVDSLAEPVVVNGLPLGVSRVTGRDVGRLVERLRLRWAEESGALGVRAGVHGTWKLLSRFRDSGLEVLQWHGADASAELLWSHSDLRTRARKPARTVLGFPAGCVPGRAVSGRSDSVSYLQQVARCRGSPRSMLAAVQSSAERRGFEVQSRTGQLVVRNGSVEVMVLASRALDERIGDAATSLVYLQLQLPERGS